MRSCTHADGVVAGMLAGAAVMVGYFLVDLVHLDPFATPVRLATVVVRPHGPDLDLPGVSQALAFLGFGVRLLAFTVLHFLVFALLGVGAAFCQRTFGVAGDVLTGAIYGLVVCTAAFYASLGLLGGEFLASPGPGSVLVANLLAGAVMGAALSVARRDRLS